QHDRYVSSVVGVVEIDQQGADRLGVDASLGLAAYQLLGDGVESAQHVESLAAAAGSNPLPLETPAVVRVRAPKEMRGVHKVDVPAVLLGLFQPGLQLIRKKIQLHLAVALAGNGPGLAKAHVETFEHYRAR